MRSVSLKHYSCIACFVTLTALSLGTPPAPSLAAADGLAWTSRFSADVQLAAVAAAKNGDAIVAGSRLLGPGQSALYVAAVDGSGAPRWTAEIPGALWAAADARALAMEASGDILVTGTVGVEHDADLIVARYDGASGQQEWLTVVKAQTTEGSTDGGAGNCLTLDSRGGVLVGGVLTVGGSPRSAAAMLDAASGDLRWTWTGSVGETRAVTVVKKAAYVVGTPFAVRLNAETGAQVWQATLPKGTASVGRPFLRAVVPDGKGNVVVAGALRNSGEDTRAFYAASLVESTGKVKWQQVGRPIWGAETAVDAVADSSSIFLGGRMAQAPTVMRLQPTNGSIKWNRRPWSPDGAPDARTGVLDLVADDGCVYAAGSDGGERFLVTALSTGGGPKWKSDLGAGRAVSLAAGGGTRLFAVGVLVENETPTPVLAAYGKAASTSRR